MRFQTIATEYQWNHALFGGDEDAGYFVVVPFMTKNPNYSGVAKFAFTDHSAARAFIDNNLQDTIIPEPQEQPAR